MILPTIWYVNAKMYDIYGMMALAAGFIPGRER
jgi:hypothetical protein